MNEQYPSASDSSVPSRQPSADAAAAPPRTRWRGSRWLLITAIVLMLLVLLSLLAPTIASMSWARSIILSQINKNLNGRVQIEDWSLGWFSGTELRGLRISEFHPEGDRQILELKHLSTGLTVSDLLRGKYFALGKTKLEDLAFTLQIDENGVTNFQKLGKGPSSNQPLNLSGFAGDFDLQVRGTIERAMRKPDGSLTRTAIAIEPGSSIKLSGASTDGPWKDRAEIRLRSASGQQSSLLAEGTLRLFERGSLNLAKLTGEFC